MDTVLDARPDLFNHNVETAPRLYPTVRPQADYQRSLRVLLHAAQRGPSAGGKLYTKSGFMVGLGEEPEEIREILRDLRDARCAIVTIGQYLAPSPAHVPVPCASISETVSAVNGTLSYAD